MTIFSPNRCNICQEREAPEGKRCDYCQPRYDAKGEPFTIYCDQLLFERKLMANQPYQRVYIWLMDDKVVKAPAQLEVMGLKSYEALEKMDELKYEYVRENKTVW